MKRKKWSELEEQTLLTKYSELLNSGTLSKLKTREKKFKPIADHVNSVHHLQDPINFPFKWSWRDVSIKVQNMRHQYLGVKQKIRISDNEFDWNDGQNHWENFLKYKEVFGDVELEVKANGNSTNVNNKRASLMQEAPYLGDFGDDEEGAAEFLGDEDVLGLDFGIDSEGMDGEEDEDEGGFGEDVDVGVSDGELRGERDEIDDLDFNRGKKWKKGFDGKSFRRVSAQVLELRDALLRREDKRRERECNREEDMIEREQRKRERRNFERNEDVETGETNLEERQIMWARREMDRRARLEREIDEERRKRMKMEERWEEEKMEWREKMVGMQIEHEKQMIQMHADACQNQLQILGVVARLMCQFFGAPNDGLGGGLGTLPPQVLQNLQHPGGLGDGVKPDASSPSEFL
ncbi:OLC1v1010653C1 [Oldenlandia corymbosa var. corymbosa]|uniref:OLC1v1010653C1 n=1 Tax=Oldenlandia corymbosa var. corymbosa TaxID=529605 RepID=A0AAV1DSF0_OLDCO|nr:OLC1v1010653C1 [Oldenlandia corymbosa var. corymbosa]